MGKIKNFFKKYSPEMTAISLLVGILGISGFSVGDIPAWYSQLSFDSKIFILFFFNLIITLYLFIQKKK